MGLLFPDEKVVIEEHPVIYARKEFWIGIFALIAGVVYNYLSIAYFPTLNLKLGEIVSYIDNNPALANLPAVPTVFSLIGIIEIIAAELLARLEKIIVTNKRVITVKGIINKDISSAIPAKITDVRIDRSLFDLLLGVSTIQIMVQDVPSGLEFHSIKHASLVQSKILDLIQGKLEISKTAESKEKQG
jgi:hypothetical protein